MRKKSVRVSNFEMNCWYWVTALMLIVGVTGVGATELTDQFIPTYRVDQPTTFSLTNIGAEHYVFTWTDDGATNSVNDPVLILSENVTYTFSRDSSSHPFGVVSGSMPTAVNFDFSLNRDTASPESFILSNGAGLIGNPASQPNSVVWTPEAGDYHYTCMVSSHPAMTGRIRVVPAVEKTTPSIVDFVIIADFAALVLSNVVENQTLIIQATDNLMETPFETRAALLVEFDEEEVFIQGFTNRSGFVRAIVE
mgnify:CR=1 FL=1